jgi:3-oxoacyl-[acyl-carrier protein] reductase
MIDCWNLGPVVITGGTGLVGQATARAFLEAGADCVVAVGSSAERAEKTLLRMSAFGDRFQAFAFDVSQAEQVERLFEQVEERIGVPGALVNAAGINHNAAIRTISADEFDRVIGVNLKAAFLTGRRACEAMKTAGIAGRVVNISSGNYRYVRPGSSIYSATKAGLDMLTRAFALEYGDAGIAVNSVAPGLVMNDENDNPFYGQVVEYYRQMSPNGRITSANDVAQIVLFLASHASRAITGDIIIADGGFSSGRLDFPTPVTLKETPDA